MTEKNADPSGMDAVCDIAEKYVKEKGGWEAAFAAAEGDRLARDVLCAAYVRKHFTRTIDDNDNPINFFAQYLRSAGFTLRDAAKAIGISRVNLHYILSGKKIPSRKEAILMSKMLGGRVHPAYFIFPPGWENE